MRAAAPTDTDDRFDDSCRPRRTHAHNGSKRRRRRRLTLPPAQFRSRRRPSEEATTPLGSAATVHRYCRGPVRRRGRPAIGEFRGSQLRRHGSVHRRRRARSTTTFPRPPRGGSHLLRGGYAMTGLAAGSKRSDPPSSRRWPLRSTLASSRSRPGRRVRGQEGGALRVSGCGSERHHEAVERDDQDPVLDALHASGAHDAQDGERSASAPTPPPAVEPGRHSSHAGHMAGVEALGLSSLSRRRSRSGRSRRCRCRLVRRCR